MFFSDKDHGPYENENKQTKRQIKIKIQYGTVFPVRSAANMTETLKLSVRSHVLTAQRVGGTNTSWKLNPCFSFCHRKDTETQNPVWHELDDPFKVKRRIANCVMRLHGEPCVDWRAATWKKTKQTNKQTTEIWLHLWQEAESLISPRPSAAVEVFLTSGISHQSHWRRKCGWSRKLLERKKAERNHFFTAQKAENFWFSPSVCDATQRSNVYWTVKIWSYYILCCSDWSFRPAVNLIFAPYCHQLVWPCDSLDVWLGSSCRSGGGGIANTNSQKKKKRKPRLRKTQKRFFFFFCPPPPLTQQIVKCRIEQSVRDGGNATRFFTMFINVYHFGDETQLGRWKKKKIIIVACIVEECFFFFFFKKWF